MTTKVIVICDMCKKELDLEAFTYRMAVMRDDATIFLNDLCKACYDDKVSAKMDEIYAIIRGTE